MTLVETLFLGIIQGLTEFLPISSSGHLVLFQNLLGFREPELLLNCTLHLGTLIAVCLYFRSDLRKMAAELFRLEFKGAHASLALWVFLGTFPTAIIGLIFKSPIERLFGSVTIVGAMLILTGAILIATGVILALTKYLPQGYGTRKQVGLWTALAVGAVQGFAVIPGISRSGATIACGLLCGLDRELAGRFSFLLSIPAIIGAVVVQWNGEDLIRVGLVPLLLGFIGSFAVGFLALKVLMGMVRKGHLHYFAPYCWAVGLTVIIAEIL